jgi:hypothetical protein
MPYITIIIWWVTFFNHRRDAEDAENIIFSMKQTVQTAV